MGFNRFFFTVSVHVILITLSLLGALHFAYITHQWATAFLFGLIALFFTGRLIYYVNKTNRVLGNFLVYLSEEDPTITFVPEQSRVQKTFRGLFKSFQQIIDGIKEKRLEKELQAQYLDTLVEHINAGIITYDHSGAIRLCNKAAKSFLGIREAKDLKDIGNHQPEFAQRLRCLSPGDHFIEKVHANNQLHQLSVKASFIKSKADQYIIIAMNDIKSEMEEQEIESWKKLIRVITHEIMNSITPITTLTTAIKRKLDLTDTDYNPPERVLKNIEEAITSTGIIEERSHGLIHFINQYKRLTKLPPLEMQKIDARSLFDRIEYLFREQMNEKKISFKTTVIVAREFLGDQKMVEQVLINLVKNAVEALEFSKDPEIELKSFVDGEGRKIIQVSDNGPGIPPDRLEQVFVPFFSTKEKGSGIGLSLSKQIIRLHKGEIYLQTAVGKGTTFFLRF
jgi:two-component system nitrogen regulation sensor histidine kinase NtrY